MKLDRLFVGLPLGQLQILLIAVAGKLAGGLTVAEAQQFCAKLQRLSIDDDLLVETGARHEGESLPFAIEAWKQDGDNLEVVFIAPTVLADLVAEEVKTLYCEAPLRVLRGGTKA